MPLHDHFRPPLSVRRHWHAFHSAWATYLAAHVNQLLPPGYFAEPKVQFGIEIDVAVSSEGEFYVAETAAGWMVPAPTQTVPVAIVSDVVEVLVYEREGGPILAGAIELVSPANKDRPEHHAAFANKCAAYLQQGIGLVIVDVVTIRRANLHEAILKQAGSAENVPLVADLYAVAYRPVERGEQPSLDIWQHPLNVGQALPTLPLWLRGNVCLGVDLESTYSRTYREQRISIEVSWPRGVELSCPTLSDARPPWLPS